MKVALEKNAVGYISLGKVDDTVKLVSVDGVTPTEGTVLDSSYSLQRGFLCLTRKDTSQRAMDFLSYCLSGVGQEIVKKAGFIRVSG